MASLIDIAIEYIEEAKDGIAYIAIWKTGRSWYAESFYPDDMPEEDTPIWSADDLKQLRKIAATNSNAVLLNGYYHNLGGEYTTIKNLAQWIRYHYENQTFLVADYIEGGNYENS